jgi:transposase
MDPATSLARAWGKISPKNGGATQATVEAFMFSLRSRGTKALEEPATKRRLSDLSEQQVIEVGNRLQRLKPEIARAWSAAEVKILVQARIKCPIL